MLALNTGGIVTAASLEECLDQVHPRTRLHKCADGTIKSRTGNHLPESHLARSRISLFTRKSRIQARRLQFRLSVSDARDEHCFLIPYCLRSQLPIVEMLIRPQSLHLSPS